MTEPEGDSFERIVAYSLSGVTSSPPSTALELPPVPGCTTITVELVTSMDDRLEHADRELALRSAALKGLFQGDADLQGEIASIRSRRSRGGTQLLITLRGPAELDRTEPHKDLGEYVFGFDLARKAEVRQKTDPAVAAIASAVLAAAAPTAAALSKIADSVYYFDGSRKAHYVSNVMAGSARAIAARPWTSEDVDRLGQFGRTALRSRTLERVFRLYAGTLSPELDRFRCFLGAWTAMEVLVNKLFPEIESRFFAEVAEKIPSKVNERIREVMRDRYRLSDKFALIAASLRPDEAERDSVVFAMSKKMRDQLLHGEDVADDQLTVHEVQDLLAKYLSAYLKTIA